MAYLKFSPSKIIFLAVFFLTGCGGGSSNNSDEINLNLDRPIFNRELAAKAPVFSPSGSITDTTPSFTWIATPNATDYRLGYEDTETETNWIERTESSSFANCNETCTLSFVDTPLSVDDEKVWWVRAKVNGIWLDWSKGNIFKVIDSVNTNTNPEIISPIGQNASVNPEFSWSVVSQASRYQFGFENPNAESDWKSYILSLSESSCAANENSCSFTPSDSGLISGDTRRWWVRAETNGVWGEWSEGKDFTINQSVADERAFIFIVKGKVVGSRNPTTFKDFKIGIDPNFSYNYSVDCDSDGALEIENTSTGYTCVYDDIAPNFSEHKVSITGVFPSLSSNSVMIEDVLQWGTQVWRSMENTFASSRLTIVSATDVPDLSKVSSMHSMFHSSFITQSNIGDWDVSNVTDMSQMFFHSPFVNPDISNWDVSNVTNMSAMFNRASAFNQDIGNWDVSNVTKINDMFLFAIAFDQDIGNWNTSNIKDMTGVFNGAKAFNQDISNWDVSNVINMSGMFSGAVKFDQNIGNWDVSNVTDMQYMFDAARVFNQDIGNWDVSKVSNMTAMFSYAKKFNQDIGRWDVSNVQSMKEMFGGNAGGTTNAKTFNQPIGGWDVSKVTDMSEMFANTLAFNQDLSSWDVSKVTSMKNMFNTAIAFNKPIANWNVANVANMANMFENATAFNQNIANWNVSKVTNMSRMFKDTENFDQDIGNWDISKVNTIFQMFAGVPFVTLSSDNYDKLLIGWSNLQLQPNLSFDAGNSKYSSAASTARNKITNQFGWTISDGGML